MKTPKQIIENYQSNPEVLRRFLRMRGKHFTDYSDNHFSGIYKPSRKNGVYINVSLFNGRNEYTIEISSVTKRDNTLIVSATRFHNWSGIYTERNI